MKSISVKVLEAELKIWRDELKQCRRLKNECDQQYRRIFADGEIEAQKAVNNLITSLRKLKQ